jgi:hypothetical protein
VTEIEEAPPEEAMVVVVVYLRAIAKKQRIKES